MVIKQIFVKTQAAICLGKQGENEVVEVIFPQPPELMAEEWQLNHQRATDREAYPCPLEKRENNLVWRVTSGDTAVHGIGAAELTCYGQNGEILKSRTYSTSVLKSITTGGEVPDPVKPWYDDIMQRLDQGGGGSGTPGEDGGYYTPEITQTDTGTMTVSYTASGADMPAIEPVTVELPQGPAGETGPAGPTGPKGETGPQGPAGKDGGYYTPEITQADTGTMTVSYTASGADMPAVESVTVELPQGPAGADGYTPQRGVDYWTDADQESIVQQVITALGTPVFGTVDADKVITLSGALAEGTYTIRYEDADGNYITIGILDNREVGYTNQLAIATDENGAVWNGVGYADGYRLNSYSGVNTGGNNALTSTDGWFVTGFIPYTLEQAKSKVPFYVKGITLDLTNLSDYLRASMTVPGSTDWFGVAKLTDMTAINLMTITQLGESYYKFTPNKNFYTLNVWNDKNPTHIRFSMPGSGAGVTITVNEPIE